MPFAVLVTAPSAAADECYTWSRTLRQGATGSDVRQLQIRVAGWAAYRSYIALDGDFGPATEDAVVRFQGAYGLAADGIAGPATFGKIYELQKPDCSPAHFNFTDFDNGCGIGGWEGGRLSAATTKANALRQMWKVEAMQRKLGDQRLTVTSAFRSIACNEQVGGASNSQHLYGTAVDLIGPPLCTIARDARHRGFSGIFGPGYPGHDDHTHVDSRAESGLSYAWSAPDCGITGGPGIAEIEVDV